MNGKLDPEERVLENTLLDAPQPMQLTPEMIAEINEAMSHTKKDGSYNWLTTDKYEINLAGAFAADKFIVIKNASKKPWQPSAPHPNFDYDKGEFKNMTGDA